MEPQIKKSNLEIRRAALEIIKLLPERQSDVLIKRFGLNGGKGRPLEEIGKEYKITRERVRQIVSQSFKKIRKSEDFKKIKPILEEIHQIFREHGGLVSEKRIIENIFESGEITPKNIHSLIFILELDGRYKEIKSDEDLSKFWLSDKESLSLAKRLIKEAVKIFKSISKTATLEEIIREIKAEKIFAESDKIFSREAVLSYFELSKEVKQNYFGRWGLAGWSEITPRGVKDKIYLILKKEGKPLHYKKIVDLINKIFLTKRKKPIRPQTAHNELIRNGRFVLVGRGIYALKEWGFKKGTVRDVLTEILKKENQPMSQEELVEKVLKKRYVKPETVISNLKNSRYFDKLKDGRYQLRSQKSEVKS